MQDYVLISSASICWLGLPACVYAPEGMKIVSNWGTNWAASYIAAY